MHLVKNFILIQLLIQITLYGASSEPVHGENGMVVSSCKYASLAGIEILKKGGNAVDAAVATGFALAVTLPNAGNLGGGGFMVGVMNDGSNFSLDFREKAPGKAKKDMFLDSERNIVPFMSLYNHAASGVPGTVCGLLTALEDQGSGKLNLGQILAPAIKLSSKGFILTQEKANLFNSYRELFENNDAAKNIFIKKNNRSWKAGDKIIQNDLANTLRRIRKNGLSEFYKKHTANLIVDEMERGNGLISYEDLNNYSSSYRKPVIGLFHNYKIISMGPPSSGGVLLINMLNMLEKFNLDTIGWNSSDYIHLLTEVERRAYADRSEHMGDPDFWSVPVEMLTSKNYANNRIKDISFSLASKSKDVFSGDPYKKENTETTHYSIIDRSGNAISVTTTLNTNFGSGIVVRGAGFFLNNEMDDFVSKPGTPNYYGLVGNEANSIEANKRPLSSMTPTIVIRNGSPFIILGSPGGSTIITSVMQVILNTTIFGMNIQEAVSSPRFHSQWLPDMIMIEPKSFPKDIINNLKKRGHNISIYRSGYIGEVNAILINEDSFYGAADVRTDGSAISY
tara:strand:- start:1061 stop:2758 length:1698 start_codon:yes stop_codon:yes gene_type:complete